MEPAINKDTGEHYRSVRFGYPVVAHNVGGMTFQPMPYADADTTADMHADCAACFREMRLPQVPDVSARVLGEAPSIEYADFPREIRKTEITVSAAAARLANTLHLHLD